MQRPVARCGRCARTGAGATRPLAQIPRIARERMKARQAGRQHAVVGHGGLGETHRPRFAQTRCGGRVGHGRKQLHGSRAERRGLALGGDVFLDGERNAVKQADGRVLHPARFAGPGLGERALRVQQIGGTQLRLPLRHAVQHGLRDLDGRELAGAIRGQQFAGAEFVEGSRHQPDLFKRGRRNFDTERGAPRTTMMSDGAQAHSAASNRKHHAHASADRSLTNTGMSFHRPRRFLLATVTHCGW